MDSLRAKALKALAPLSEKYKHFIKKGFFEITRNFFENQVCLVRQFHHDCQCHMEGTMMFQGSLPLNSCCTVIWVLQRL